MIEPVCGTFDESVDSLWDKLKGLFGLVAVYTIGKEIWSAVDTAGQTKVFFDKAINFLGVQAATGFYLWAILVYAVSVYLLFRLWYDDCVASPDGVVRCISGVVEQVNDDSVGLIFNARHPSIDVVVKSAAWPLIALNADRIFCSNAGGSMLRVFFKSSRVCGAKLGALAGGAAAGLGGIVAAAAAAAAIGCASVIACIVALVVAAIIVLAAVAAGATAGGAIGAAAAEDNVPEFADGTTVAVSDLVSVEGPLAKHGNFDGAIVQYFNEEIWLLGRAPAGPSYQNSDADELIPDNMEACYEGPIVV